MKKLIFFSLFLTSIVKAENNVQFFIESALKNNLKLNAERKNQESIKQNINISKSEFLPSVSLSADQNSTQSSNKTSI